MTNRKNNGILLAGLVVATILTLGIMVAPLTVGQTQAQSKKLTCDTTKDCNIIIRRLRVGDDLIIQFKASPYQGGGGSTAPQATVDQQARDDITNLKTTDASQDNNIQRLETANTELNNQIIALQGENSALKDNLTTINSAMILQTQAIQELQTAVKNITDANPFVDLNVTGNQSQGEPNPLPPQGNETTGAGENQTTTPPVGGNESTTNPPSNETSTNPPTGNESNTVPIDNQTGQPIGNITLPVVNQTQPGEGNITLPIEGNITLPGESNVTIPLDNSSGNIIIDNGSGSILENNTNLDSGNSTLSGDIVGFRNS
jgi:hypothetical protein